MGLIDILGKIYEESIDQIEDGLETAADFASEIVASFEDNLDTLEQSFQDLAASSQDATVLSDLALELIRAIILDGENVQSRIAAVIDMSMGHILDAGESLILDFLTLVFEEFKGQFEYYRIIVQSVFTHLDFEKLFESILVHTSANFQNYYLIVEVLLAPVFSMGLITKGPEKMAVITAGFLKSNSTALSQRININEIIPSEQSFLSTIRNDRFFDFTAAQYCFVGIFEILRRGSNFYGTNAFFYELNNPILKLLCDSVLSFFDNIYTLFIGPFVDVIVDFFQEFLSLAEQDIELEWRLLELARITPLGLLFLMIAIPYKLLTSPAPFINLIFNPIEEDPNLKTLRLPCPDKENKYIFFSDIHRDAREDKRPDFQFLSIDHFDPNGDQYLELLEHYDSEGYTIIEVGDCEELWFHRDFSIRPAQKLQSVIDTHRPIYDKLKDLHDRGKYFRVYGNHDSYLWEDGQTRAVMFDHFDSVDHPFEIYDFIIIDGVKTMTDVMFYLGLDSEPNQERKPMIVTHGHQWDFWNCNANNILGKLIVSAVVTPLDFLDDPFRDIGGIASKGSPAVNFKSILADLFVYNNWLSPGPANRRADEIQHTEDETRLFVDDIMYSESLASLMGNLIFVKSENACHTYDTLCEEDYVLFNLLCIGHTHNPQNMPYHELEDLPLVGEYINQFENVMEGLTGGLIPFETLSLVKSNYINTGTSGWWENTLWALDLGNVSHCTGQPKLVNWSGNTKVDSPNEMNWELPHLSHDGPNSEGERLEQLHEDIRQWISDLLQQLRTRGEQLIVRAPAGGILDLVQFNNGNAEEFEISVPAELHGVLDRIIQIVCTALNNLAILCKEAINFSISLRIELPKSYMRVISRHSQHIAKSEQHQFIQIIGLIAAKDLISKVQFRDSDRGAKTLSKSVEDKLNSSLMTLAWLFNPNNSYRGPKNNIKLDSAWRIEKGELHVRLNFQKSSNILNSKK